MNSFALLPFLAAGSEARRVFDDAQRMLNKMIDDGSLKGKGLVGFWPAQSEGDDINVYQANVTAPRQTEPIAKFHGLRQQVSSRQLLYVLTFEIFLCCIRRDRKLVSESVLCL